MNMNLNFIPNLDKYAPMSVTAWGLKSVIIGKCDFELNIFKFISKTTYVMVAIGIGKMLSKVIPAFWLRYIDDEVSAIVATIITQFIKHDALYKMPPKNAVTPLILSLFRRMLNLVFILRRVNIPPLTGHELSEENISSLTLAPVTVTLLHDSGGRIWRIKNLRIKSPNLLGQILLKTPQALLFSCL